MNIKQYEEKIKKGCGREMYIYEDGNGFGDVAYCDNQELCLYCRAKLQTIQECKKIFEEMIEESKCHCELCAFQGNHDGFEEGKLIKATELFSQLNGEKEKDLEENKE